MSTMTASGMPIVSGVNFRPTPTRAMAKKPAAMRPRHRVSSIRSPAKPSEGGQQRERGDDRDGHHRGGAHGQALDEREPMSSMPSREITTVVPAKSTDRPAVSIATPIDSRTVCPAWSCSR